MRVCGASVSIVCADKARGVSSARPIRRRRLSETRKRPTRGEEVDQLIPADQPLSGSRDVDEEAIDLVRRLEGGTREVERGACVRTARGRLCDPVRVGRRAGRVDAGRCRVGTGAWREATLVQEDVRGRRRGVRLRRSRRSSLDAPRRRRVRRGGQVVVAHDGWREVKNGTCRDGRQDDDRDRSQPGPRQRGRREETRVRSSGVRRRRCVQRSAGPDRESRSLEATNSRSRSKARGRCEPPEPPLSPSPPRPLPAMLAPPDRKAPEGFRSEREPRPPRTDRTGDSSAHAHAHISDGRSGVRSPR